MSNIVILEGHIGHDLELKTTNTSGKAVLNFRMATNRTYNNAQQQKVEDTQWHNIVCWDKTAINVAGMQRKGSHVLIEGRLQTRTFLGQAKYDNGQVVVDGAGQPIMVVRYTTEIVARRVRFLDKKPGTATYPQATGVAVQPAAAFAPIVAAAPVVAAPIVAAPIVAAAPVVAAPIVAAPVVAATPATVGATFVGAAPAPATVPATAVVVQPVNIPGV